MKLSLSVAALALTAPSAAVTEKMSYEDCVTETCGGGRFLAALQAGGGNSTVGADIGIMDCAATRCKTSIGVQSPAEATNYSGYLTKANTRFPAPEPFEIIASYSPSVTSPTALLELCHDATGCVAFTSGGQLMRFKSLPAGSSRFKVAKLYIGDSYISRSGVKIPFVGRRSGDITDQMQYHLPEFLCIQACDTAPRGACDLVEWWEDGTCWLKTWVYDNSSDFYYIATEWGL